MGDIISEHLSREFASNIRLLLHDLLKLVKVLAMYPPDNPLPAKMRRSLSSRFAEVVNEFNGLSFVIQPDKIFCRNEEVFVDQGSEERLAGLLFDAGIIQLEFIPGITVEEINIFLDLVKNHINPIYGDDDLVSMLWQAQLSLIKYRTVDDLAFDEQQTEITIREIYSEYNDNPGGGWSIDVNEISLSEGDTGGTPVVDSEQQEIVEDGEKMGLSLDSSDSADDHVDNLLTSSYMPVAEERKEMSRLLAENKNFEPARSVTRILLEALEIWDDLKRFSETVNVCEKTLDQLLRNGEFSAAADFVHSIRVRENALISEQPEYAERLTRFLQRAGNQDRIARLTEIINQQDTVDTDTVERYLESLGWESLPHIAEMLAGLVSKKSRFMICDFLACHGREHLGIIANGIRDKRWYVVRNTVMILGRIGGEQVIQYLTATAGHSDQRVRAETFKALGNIQSDKTIEQLARYLNDSDPQLRNQALTTLGRIGGRAAFEAVHSIVRSSSFNELTIDEQEQYLIVYSHIGGAEVTEYLNSRIGSFGLFPSASRIRQRLMALKALAYNMSDDAEKIILAYTRSRRQWLRTAATAALEHRRKLIYGGGESGDTDNH
jgi:HEAT repeat protein